MQETREDEIDFDIYNNDAVEEYLDSDGISSEEEGFLIGYLQEETIAE